MLYYEMNADRPIIIDSYLLWRSRTIDAFDWIKRMAACSLPAGMLALNLVGPEQ
jgi:hypothetical protein